MPTRRTPEDLPVFDAAEWTFTTAVDESNRCLLVFKFVDADGAERYVSVPANRSTIDGLANARTRTIGRFDLADPDVDAITREAAAAPVLRIPARPGA